MKNNWSCSKGITLVEVVVALAMGSMLMSAVYTVYVNQVRGQAVQEASLDLQQGVRAALTFMKQEIRTAGADPTGKAGAGIIRAEVDEFHFTRDVNDLANTGRHDGAVSASNENIRYRVNQSGALGRDTCRPQGGGSWTCSGLQSILDNVDVLAFAYFDETGQQLDPADLQTPEDNNRIRLVQVTLIAHYGLSGRGLLPRHQDTRLYRDPQGEPLVAQPFNDHRRRLKMSTAIARRNT